MEHPVSRVMKRRSADTPLLQNIPSDDPNYDQYAISTPSLERLFLLMHATIALLLSKYLCFFLA